MAVKYLQKFTLFIIRYTIRFVLFAFVTTTVLVVLVGKSSDVKAVLQQTNSYERFVPAVIESNKESQAAKDAIDYSDPNISRIFNESFPAEDIKNNTEEVIDGAYNWLTKKSPNLTFTIDLTANKELLAAKLSTYAFDRIQLLQPCKTPPEEINPLTVTCNPKGYVRKDAQESYRQQILSSTDFLRETIFTASDLPKNKKGQTFVQQYSYAPTVFTWLQRAPYLLGGILLLQAILFIVLTPKKRKGISGLSSILMGSGISLALFPILYDIVIPYFTKSYEATTAGTGTQAIFNDIAKQVTSQFNTYMIAIGIQMVAAGLTVYLLEKVIRKTPNSYSNVAQKSGVASSNDTRSPKSLRGLLNTENIPLQSSERPPKQSAKKATNSKYSKLYNKKEM